MGFAVLIKNHLHLTVFISVALQIIGTAILGLFSFYGLTITQSQTVFSKGQPMAHVSVNTKWLQGARAALILLLLGIFLSGMAGLASLD